MQTSSVTLTAAEIAAIEKLRATVGMREAARQLGIGHDTAYRAVAGLSLYRGTATQIRIGLRLHTPSGQQP